MNRYLGRKLLGLLIVVLIGMMTISGHATEKIIYYHNDHLGSPIAATNSQGEVVWRESYQPYGKRELKQGDKQSNLWYSGKQEESAFGLSYFGARWYSPELGRFMSMDPVGVSPDNAYSFNRYAYANGNPYRFVDPDGKAPIQIGDGPFGLGALPGGGGGAIGADALGGIKLRPYLGPVQYHGPKPKYVVNPAHLPAGNGRAVNPNKDLLPGDADAAFTRAVPDTMNVFEKGEYKGQPRTWWAEGKDGTVYRYGHGNNGTAHYNGSFEAKSDLIPKNVRDRLYQPEGGGGGGSLQIRVKGAGGDLLM